MHIRAEALFLCLIFVAFLANIACQVAAAPLDTRGLTTTAGTTITANVGSGLISQPPKQDLPSRAPPFTFIVPGGINDNAWLAESGHQQNSSNLSGGSNRRRNIVAPGNVCGGDTIAFLGGGFCVCSSVSRCQNFERIYEADNTPVNLRQSAFLDEQSLDDSIVAGIYGSCTSDDLDTFVSLPVLKNCSAFDKAFLNYVSLCQQKKTTKDDSSLLKQACDECDQSRYK